MDGVFGNWDSVEGTSVGRVGTWDSFYGIFIYILNDVFCVWNTTFCISNCVFDILEGAFYTWVFRMVHMIIGVVYFDIKML